MIFSVLIAILFTNHSLFSESRMDFCVETRILELNSFNIYTIFPFVYYLDFKFLLAVSLPGVDYTNITYYQSQISEIR